MKLSKRLIEIRKAEALTCLNFSQITGISLKQMNRYESGKFAPCDEILLKVTQSSRFEKYTMWLMTGTILPEVGQISPALSPDGQS